MINTQKLTALGFAFYDGYRSKRSSANDNGRDSKLNADQEKQKVTDLPSPIEYLSYIFYFHGICVGPLCFFKDYMNYIDGSNLQVIPTSSARESVSKAPADVEQPSTFWPVTTKMAQCAIWGYILLSYTPVYTVEFNLSPEMVNSPWVKRLTYLLFSTFCTRAK